MKLLPIEGDTSCGQAIFGDLDFFGGVYPESDYHERGAALFTDDGGIRHCQDGRRVYDHQVECFAQVAEEFSESGLHKQFGGVGRGAAPAYPAQAFQFGGADGLFEFQFAGEDL